MVVQQGLSEIEARLVAAGFTGGVHTLVERWRQHRSALAGSSLTWEYDDAGLYPPRHQAAHDHGIFVVDATGYRDEWVLKHEWSGWGWRELGNGDARELKAKALQLLRWGGPFGGASELFRGRNDPKTCCTSGMLRHASGRPAASGVLARCCSEAASERWKRRSPAMICGFRCSSQLW